MQTFDFNESKDGSTEKLTSWYVTVAKYEMPFVGFALDVSF